MYNIHIYLTGDTFDIIKPPDFLMRFVKKTYTTKRKEKSMKNRFSPVIIVFSIIITLSMLSAASALPVCYSATRTFSFVSVLSSTIKEIKEISEIMKSDAGIGNTQGEMISTLLGVLLSVIYLVVNVMANIMIFVNFIRIFVSFKNRETRDMKIFGYLAANIGYVLTLTAFAFIMSTGHGVTIIGPGGYSAIGSAFVYIILLFIYNLFRKASRTVKKLNVLSFITNIVLLAFAPAIFTVYDIMTGTLFHGQGLINGSFDGDNVNGLLLSGGFLILFAFLFAALNFTASTTGGINALAFPPREKDYKRNMQRGGMKVTIVPPTGLAIFIFVLYVIGFVLVIVSGQMGDALVLAIVLCVLLAATLIITIIMNALIKKAASPINMKTALQFYNDINVGYLPQSAMAEPAAAPAQEAPAEEPAATPAQEAPAEEPAAAPAQEAPAEEPAAPAQEAPVEEPAAAPAQEAPAAEETAEEVETKENSEEQKEI